MNTISLRNAASAVFLCVAEEIAHDLSARLIWAAKEIDQLQDDNLRLSNLITKFDTALRTIATEAGMSEAFTGVDCDPECKPLVERVKKLKELKEMADIYISDFFKEASTCDGCKWWSFPSDWTGAQYGDCSYPKKEFPAVSNVTHCGPKFGCIHWEQKP